MDSSALITLAGAGALSLLPLARRDARTVPEVYRETVEVGLSQGYPDARAIGDCFRRGWIQAQSPKRPMELPGLSRTDSLVLRLAEETAAAGLLVNDRTLLRKAEQRNLPARVTLEFVWERLEARQISRRRFDQLLFNFRERRRYSEEFLEAFLLGR